MNCFNHIELVSVAVCQDCQKGLCTECSTKYNMPICTQCNTKRKKGEKAKIYKELFLMLVFGILGYYAVLQVHTPLNSSLLKAQIFEKVFLIVTGFYFGGAVVAGWKTLNRITPDIFLFLPIVGWLIFFMAKFLLSIIVGVFMLPIRLFRNFRRLYLLKAIPK